MKTEELKDILAKTLSKNKKHANYDRVCKLSKEYKAFITDEEDGGKRPLDDYLRQFVRREDDELFEQRKKLTKHYTPSICSKIIRTFEKVTRSNKVQKLIEHADAKVVQELQASMDNFYGESQEAGVDKFLSERFKTLTFTDPNAWIWVSFKEYDYRFEKPTAFPSEISSTEAIDFYTDRFGKTEWLIAQFEYDYICKKQSSKKALRYVIFSDQVHVEFKEIPTDIGELFDYSETHQCQKTKKKYAVLVYEHKLSRMPLMRVGYREDISTNSKTFVNPFHYEAMPLLRQFIKISSELQLSISLHTFPKQISYVSPCTAKGCNSGILLDGQGTCKECSGTGLKKTHTTSADMVEIPMPKSLADIVDASKLSAYIPFPADVMKFLDQYADKMEKKILRMVFNSESLIQTQFHTATEAEIDVDSIYDTLTPFARKYSEMWMFVVKIIAELLHGAKNEIEIWHKYPTDFKLKSMNQLLSELKLANDSGAPSYIREGLNNDIAEIIYADDQEELARIRIKNKFFPFPGKTDLEIQNIIMTNLATKAKQILYANFDSIFDEVEQLHPDFYHFVVGKQRKIIDDIVHKIADQLETIADVPKFETDG